MRIDAIMTMLDQYNQPVPDDLVVLDLNIGDLTADVRKAIDQIKWYAPVDNPKLIVVSWEELCRATESYGLFDATDPLDVDLDLSKGVQYIDGVLHRYNDTDGFYHA